MDQETLERDFDKAFGALAKEPAASLEDFFGFFDDAALFVDEDNPFVLDMEGFRDHLGFHTDGNWEWIDWKARNAEYKVYGSTGLVIGAFTFRGKPTDVGFRQRHGLFSVVCFFDEGRSAWRGGKLHLSPLLSHIHHCSPS